MPAQQILRREDRHLRVGRDRLELTVGVGETGHGIGAKSVGIWPQNMKPTEIPGTPPMLCLAPHWR